jgi:hypothetical protein
MSIELTLQELIEENISLENTKKYKKYKDEINRRIEINNILIEELQSGKQPEIKIEEGTIEDSIEFQVNEMKNIVELAGITVEIEKEKRGRKKKKVDNPTTNNL